MNLDDWYLVYYDVPNDYIFVRHVMDTPGVRTLLGEVILLGPLGE